MSYFTAPLNEQPTCPRCKRPQFVALVKRSGEFAIWDCLQCVIKPPVRKE